MSVSPEQLKSFYISRSKNPDNYTYDENGNLIEKTKTGEIIKTIALPTYRPTTSEEYHEMENKRINQIAIAEKDYENAREELRAAYENPNTPMSEILRINRRANESDFKLMNARYATYYIENIDSLEVRDLIFTDIYEQRKYPYQVHSFKTFPFKAQDFYVRIGEAAKTPIKTLAEIKEKYTGIPVIIITDDSDLYKELSLKWQVVINFNNTIYNSAYQGIMAELAKYFNDEENLQKIMIEDDPNQITYSFKNIPGDLDINETKWNNKMKELLYDINYEKFKQYPELGNKLIETLSAPLGYYEPDDNLLGIGLSPDDENSKDPSKWSGQNILGKTLETIRNKLNEERAITAQQVEQIPIQSTKTVRKILRPKKSGIEPQM